MAIQLSLIKISSKSAFAIVVVLLTGLVTETALADSEKESAPPSIYDSKFTMALGGFFPRVKSSLTLSSPSGGGTEIVAEEDL